jgi:small nuclear ribonucleoprotein (snRNP)-like protein
MKFSTALEKFLKANIGQPIWVLLKESSETIFGKLAEFDESVIVLNIAKRQRDTVEMTDVLLLLDLDSILGVTAGIESFEVFQKAMADTRSALEARRRRTDERETI